ncbi:hypothetical protein M0Q50_02070 [bacterium]|jgi:hypothetical protein|nr:hypothetical protein [bacterium]
MSKTKDYYHEQICEGMENMTLDKILGYVIQDLTFKDEPVYLGVNNVNVCKIRSANIYIDDAHTKHELKLYIEQMNRHYIKSNVDKIMHESEFSIVPIVVMPIENEILDTLKNIMGIIDTPIGRRKLGETDMLMESIKDARKIFEKYKI